VGRLKVLLAPALLLALASQAATAQDGTDTRLVLNEVVGLDHASCIESLEARKVEFAKLKRVTSSGYRMLNHAYEGHNFACEAARIGLEVARLLERHHRLQVELVRIESTRGGAAPANNTDRDGERQLLIDEIKDIDAHVDKLTSVTEDLRKAAEGMLELAMADLDLLDRDDRNNLLLALDVQSQNDILCRMLGCSETKGSGGS
jgi:hypothetical protein